MSKRTNLMRVTAAATCVLGLAVLAVLGGCGGFTGDITGSIGNPNTNVDVTTGDTNVSQDQDNTQDQATGVDVNQGTDIGDDVTGDDGAPDDVVECGGILGPLCVEGEFCKMPTGTCENPDEIGVCTLIPEICTLEYSPVCGCDGLTYGNACQADAAGVSITSEGECPLG